MGWNLPEQQVGSSSRSAHKRGAVEMDAIDAIVRGAATEADTVGEQQLCTETCPATDYSCRRTRGEVAERAKQAKLLVHYTIS